MAQLLTIRAKNKRSKSKRLYSKNRERLSVQLGRPRIQKLTGLTVHIFGEPEHGKSSSKFE